MVIDAVARQLQDGVQRERERRHVLQRDADTLAAAALGDDVDGPGRHVETKPRLRLDIGITPVSSSTVAMHIVLEPDIGGYSVGSMMIAPATQSSRVDGTMRLTWRATAARLADQKAADVVVIAFERPLLVKHGRPGAAGRHRDHVADLAFGMAADDGDLARSTSCILLQHRYKHDAIELNRRRHCESVATKQLKCSRPTISGLLRSGL